MKKIELVIVSAALFTMPLILSGCHLIPDKAQIDFGKVYIGNSANETVTFSNTHASKAADVGGYSINAPFTVNGTSEVIPAGRSGRPVMVTFTPTAVGAARDEVRPGVVNMMEIQVTPVTLTGEGVYGRNEGGFSLENMPSTSFSSDPIQPGQPIDWGTRKLGDPAIPSQFQVRNTNANVNMTATATLQRGDQNFEITFPAGFAAFNISQNGTREIRVSFTPRAVGEFWDIVEITDTANPAARAGVVLKAKVSQTGE